MSASSRSTFPRSSSRTCAIASRDPWPEREVRHLQGVRLETMRALADYWATSTTGAPSRALAALPLFITEIDGLDIHFIHVRSPTTTPCRYRHARLARLHLEQLKIIGPLTDPTAHGADAADAFHLVIRRFRARLLGQADGDGLGSHPHRESLGRADGAGSATPLRRAGRRLGQRRDRAARPPQAARADRHPHEHASEVPPTRPERSDGEDRRRRASRTRRSAGVGPARPLLRPRPRLRAARWPTGRRPSTRSPTRPWD